MLPIGSEGDQSSCWLSRSTSVQTSGWPCSLTSASFSFSECFRVLVYLGHIQSHMASLEICLHLQNVADTRGLSHSCPPLLTLPQTPQKELTSYSLNTPPSIGPVLSGLLLLRWGWRSIFWFLSAASPCCLIAMIVLLPETSRSVVGDGSVEATGIRRALIPILTPKPTKDSHPAIYGPGQRKGLPNPLASLRLIRNPSTAIILVVYAANYTIYSCLQASLSALFLNIYELSNVALGLIYLPFGVACALSALATGRLLDYNYRRFALKCGSSISRNAPVNMHDFPIERARLSIVILPVVISASLITGYGWMLTDRISMSAPLVLLFFIGLTSQSLFTALNTLLVDTHQDCPSTAQAACNLVRCETAAGGLAALDLALRAMGPGWCFVLFGAINLLIVPMLLLLQSRGMKWRQSRKQ